MSREADRDRFLPWVVEEEGIRSFAHVPLSIGPRLFGVLTVADERPGACDDALLARMVAFGRAAAGAIANALDFQRERRIALALTRGFIPGPLPELEGFDAGLVYEPSGHAAGGGDVFGIWRLPTGAVAVAGGRRQRQGDRGRGDQRDGALLRRGAHVGRRRPGGRDGTDERAAAHAARGHDVRAGRDGGDRRGARSAGATPATRRRCCSAPTAPSASWAAPDCRSASTPTRRTRPSRRRSAPATSCSRPPTGSPRPAARAASSATSGLGALLAEHGRTLHPDALVRLMRAEAEAWSPSLDDDMVILALRRRA